MVSACHLQYWHTVIYRIGSKGQRLIVLITLGKKFSLESFKAPFSDHFCLVFFFCDLFSMLNNLYFAKYADDTEIYVIGDGIEAFSKFKIWQWERELVSVWRTMHACIDSLLSSDVLIKQHEREKLSFHVFLKTCKDRSRKLDKHK